MALDQVNSFMPLAFVALNVCYQRTIILSVHAPTMMGITPFLSILSLTELICGVSKASQVWGRDVVLGLSVETSLLPGAQQHSVIL